MDICRNNNNLRTNSTVNSRNYLRETSLNDEKIDAEIIIAIKESVMRNLCRRKYKTKN